MRVLKARVKLNNKQFYIIKVNAYEYNKDKKSGNYKEKRNRVKRKKRKKEGESKKYDNLYEKKLKYF